MKIYTNTFDLSRPSPHRFWVTPYSDFKFGIKIVNAGTEVTNDFTVAAGTTELTPDADKIDGFTIFTAKSADTGFVEYTIDIEDIVQKFKLVQIITDSTVFEVGGEGGDVPADVATKTWVNSQISDFITDDALTAYATQSYVDSAISDFITDDALTAYATQSYVDSAISDFITDDALTAYYTKSETSSATELADAFANVGGGAISAYAVSDSPIQSETLIRQALVDNTCLPQTIALNKNGTIEIFDVEGTLDLHQESPFASLIPNAVKVLVGTKVTNLAGRCFWGAYKCNDIVLPNSLSGITVGSSTGEVFTGSPAKRLTIPDSVTTFGIGNIFWNWRADGGGVVDFGNTRTTIPTGGSFSTNVATTKYLVPDDLYDTWRQTGNWANVSAQVFPHSQMPGAVKGSAYAGTIGTPAAISNMQTVYETDWPTLSASAISSTFYVVVPDPE